MQLDMHFYGVYALARAAGIKAKTAYTIAYASQYVDDSIDDDTVVLDSRQQAILPTMTSHIPLDYRNALPGDQWKVWIPFHFLPGNEGRSFDERMTCRMNSDPAKKMIRDAANIKSKTYWPHLIGITAHVYADTFSHFGFIGYQHRMNKAKRDSIKASGKKHSRNILKYVRAKFEDFKTRFVSDFAEIVPVGHGAVGTYPDRPFLNWSFKYEVGQRKKSDTDRDNLANFFEGCRCLHQFFSDFSRVSPESRDPGGARAWKDIAARVKNILKTEAPKDKRIQQWKKHVAAGDFCTVTALDREVEYDERLWRPRRAEYEAGDARKIASTNACQFIRAAWRHREYVLHELLPSFGLIIY